MRYEYGLAFFCGVVVMALAGSWCSAAHTTRAFARDWQSDGQKGSRRYRGSWKWVM